ncbi:hypothetical protein LINPERHAP1_LOCUS26275 [Linum perenne]
MLQLFFFLNKELNLQTLFLRLRSWNVSSSFFSSESRLKQITRWNLIDSI